MEKFVPTAVHETKSGHKLRVRPNVVSEIQVKVSGYWFPLNQIHTALVAVEMGLDPVIENPLPKLLYTAMKQARIIQESGSDWVIADRGPNFLKFREEVNVAVSALDKETLANYEPILSKP